MNEPKYKPILAKLKESVDEYITLDRIIENHRGQGIRAPTKIVQLRTDSLKYVIDTARELTRLG